MPRSRGRSAALEQRQCGECRACCIALGFQARDNESPFEKPYGTPCPHLVQIGCGIYEDRPPVCRRFQCGWLQAPNLPKELRPDRCGVLFAVNEDLHGDGEAVYAYELRPGASEEELPAWLIDELSAQVTVVLVRDDRYEVLTADPEVQTRLEARGAFTRSG
jgi:hypothetical protein